MLVLSLFMTLSVPQLLNHVKQHQLDTNKIKEVEAHLSASVESVKTLQAELNLAAQSITSREALVNELKRQIETAEETNTAWQIQTKQQAYKECMAEFERTKSNLGVSSCVLCNPRD